MFTCVLQSCSNYPVVLFLVDALVGEIGIKQRHKVVDLSRKEGTAENLTEARINCQMEEKDYYLYYMLQQYPARTLVFANSKDCIRRLMSVCKLLQVCPLALHADMHQKQRLKNLDRFKGQYAIAAFSHSCWYFEVQDIILGGLIEQQDNLWL